MTKKSDPSYSQQLHLALRRRHYALALSMVTMHFYVLITEARKERNDRRYARMETRALKAYNKLQSDKRLK